MLMTLEETKSTQELRSTSELNSFLGLGWVLIMTYVVDVGEIGAPSGRPHFVVAWQDKSAPQYPDEHTEDRKSVLRKGINE